MAGKWGLLWSVGGDFNAIWVVGEKGLSRRLGPLLRLRAFTTV